MLEYPRRHPRLVGMDDTVDVVTTGDIVPVDSSALTVSGSDIERYSPAEQIAFGC